MAHPRTWLASVLICFALLWCPWTTAAENPTLKVQYKCGEKRADSNQIKPQLQIVNEGDAAVPLKELTIRYFFTIDGDKPQSYWCDWSPLGKDNITSQFGKLEKPVDTADSFLEIGFTDAAGEVKAGGASGEIQSRFSKGDWSNYDQSNDFSFDAGIDQWTDQPKVALYRNGKLVWGTEPGAPAGKAAGGAPAPRRFNSPRPTAKTSTPSASWRSGRICTTRKTDISAPKASPYHAPETFLIEAPDYGHETTSEAISYWIWLEAQYGHVSGDWSKLGQAWTIMEKYMIPTAQDQPTNSFYNAAKPATYAPEFDQPSDYPAL